MSNKLIKVCGMRDSENIKALSALPINFMGTIFYPKSPRYSGDSLATAMAFKKLSKHIQKVGVFVKPTLDLLKEYKDKFSLDYLQIHSDETLLFCQDAKEIAPIIKAFGVDENTDFNQIMSYCKVADYFIFDTATKNYGGSGVKFDWSILKKYNGNTPFLLAGGLGQEDMESIKRIDHNMFVGVDLNSRFEISAAVKDIDKLSMFITEFRSMYE